MTKELLDKGNQLKNEIEMLENSANTISRWKEGRKTESRFIVDGLYHVDLPKEITSKVEMLV